jgi:MFS transporter, DHA1 family, tetracycline resistance protein
LLPGSSPPSAPTPSPPPSAATPPAGTPPWPSWGCCWPCTTAPSWCSSPPSAHWPTASARARCCWAGCWGSRPPRLGSSPPASQARWPPPAWPRGAAAAAFSSAASTLVARLSPTRQQGRWFGSYGAWKGLGYTLGPLLGGLLVAFGGFRLLFATLAALALAVAGWAAAAVPATPPLPKARETLLGLARRLAQPSFVRPTVALAAATAALSTGVGFLPVRGAAAGLGPLATGAAVSLLAATATLVQPRAGRAYDSGRLPGRAGVAAGLALAAGGFATAALPYSPVAVDVAAVLIGAGTGVVTPLGFAALAAAAPPGRLGQTMGAAEVGRELGDAGGPLLVGAIAAPAGLAVGLLSLAAGLLGAAAWATAPRPTMRP